MANKYTLDKFYIPERDDNNGRQNSKENSFRS